MDWHISSKEAFTHYLNASYPVSLLSTANIVKGSEKSFCARILIVLGSMSSLSDQGFSEPASKNKIHWTIHVFWTIKWYSAHHDIIISETRAYFSNIMVLGAKPTWRHRELATAGKVEPQLCNRLPCWGSRRLLLLRKLQRSTKSAPHEYYIVSPN